MSEDSTPAQANLHAAMQYFESWLALNESERGVFLEDLAASQPEVCVLVRQLIAADREATRLDFLGQSAIANAEAAAIADSSLANSSVGPWRLERIIGAGGMGEVWLARRSDGFYEGAAAVKMLRFVGRGAATTERFAREAKILARLVHPHIAHLLDAGVRSDGRRFLVLEYVAGVRLDEYCDSRQLTLEDRVRLFLQVCAAVSHAHANLVVHRDLKPSNILVDAAGAVKLLDFGIAKLLEEQTADAGRSPLTELAGVALTPEYAAPEQIEGGPITTATDVYALGVVLCHLLSGFGPYTGGRSPAQMARTIVDRDPRRLSVLPPASEEELARLASSRATSPERLARAMRGDLEHIVAQALRKAPAERYPSVQALADDLQRYLSHAPVAARGDHVGYRMRRFVRRHRLAVALGAFALVATVGGLGASLWQAHRAQQQAITAERAASRAQAITHFLLGIFEANSTEQHANANAQQTTARELLDIGRTRIATELRDQPDVRAEVLKTLAEMYWQIGRTDTAAEIDAERVALLRAPGVPSRALADALIDQASTLEELGHPDEAMAVSRTALVALDALGEGPSELRAAALMQIGDSQLHADPLAAAGHLERGYTMLLKANPHSSALAGAAGKLAAAYRSLGRTGDARRILEDSIAQATGPAGSQNALTTSLYGELATLLQTSNHYSRAREAYRKFYEANLQVLGAAHAETVTSRAYYAQSLGAGGQRDLALEHLDAIIGALGPAPGELAPQFWGRAHLFRARLLLDMGDAPQAAAELARLDRAWSQSPLAKTGMYARYVLLSAQQQALSGNPVAALQWARRAEQLMTDLKLPCHVGGWAVSAAIVDYLQRVQEFEQAGSALKALDECRSAEVDETPFRVAAALAHARDALGRGQALNALGFASDAEQRIEASEDRDFYVLDAAEAHRLAGVAYLKLQQVREAKTQLQTAAALLTPFEVAASPRLGQVRAALAQLN